MAGGALELHAVVTLRIVFTESLVVLVGVAGGAPPERIVSHVRVGVTYHAGVIVISGVSFVSKNNVGVT
jgi:hypothetical protein